MCFPSVPQEVIEEEGKMATTAATIGGKEPTGDHLEWVSTWRQMCGKSSGRFVRFGVDLAHVMSIR